MIGKLIGAEPLLGKEGTKEAVLKKIHSVSLIHFAAHGDAERGEIALAPESSFNGTATEKDYLLTMADISQVQLRAKLVVLSCCHSAQGHVKADVENVCQRSHTHFLNTLFIPLVDSEQASLASYIVHGSFVTQYSSRSI